MRALDRVVELLVGQLVERLVGAPRVALLLEELQRIRDTSGIVAPPDRLAVLAEDLAQHAALLAERRVARGAAEEVRHQVRVATSRAVRPPRAARRSAAPTASASRSARVRSRRAMWPRSEPSGTARTGTVTASRVSTKRLTPTMPPLALRRTRAGSGRRRRRSRAAGSPRRSRRPSRPAGRSRRGSARPRARPRRSAPRRTTSRRAGRPCS